MREQRGHERASVRVLAMLACEFEARAGTLVPMASGEPQLLRGPRIRGGPRLAVTGHDDQRTSTAGTCPFGRRELVE